MAARRALAALLPLAAVLGSACLPAGDGAAPSACRVDRVVDGDTVYVDCLDERIRLLLIDAPEITGTPECYGEQARAYLDARLPRGKEVRLEGGVRDTDQYGRYLRYIWLGDELLNRTLIREGYARRYRDAEDRAHLDTMAAAEEAAREAGAGLWGACSG